MIYIYCTFHLRPPLYSFWWIPTERWVFDPLFDQAMQLENGCFSGKEAWMLRGSAKIGSGWPRSSPEHGNTRGFSKWRFRKWRFLEVKVEGSEGAEGPNKEENSGRRRFWVSRGSTGFQKVPEQGCQKYRLIPEAIHVLSIRFVAPGRFQECYHAGHILVQRAPWACWGEEVDFDWKGWQEYLVRWA